jgi:hypothetical protein
MDLDPPPPPLDPDLQFLRGIHLRAVDTLHGMLPPPAADSSEAWLVRDQAALASVASLVPGNPAEGRVAANHVAAMEHASQCLAEVADFPHDPKQVARLRAQAASMGREARGYLSILLRMQAIRLKRESKDSTREGAAWTEHCLLGNMTQALDWLVGAPEAGQGNAGWARGGAAPLAEARSGDAPLTEAPAAPVGATSSPRHPSAGPVVARPPQPSAASAPRSAAREPADTDAREPVDTAAREPADTDEPPRDLADEVDYYANVYPSRLRLIRKHGGLPPNCDFGPPDPELVQALLASSSPAVFAALDEPGAQPE